MKILFISSGNAKGGISPIVKNQGEAFKGTGSEVDFFTIQGNGIKGYLKSVHILRKYLKYRSYDIIHAHYGLSGITGWLGKKKVPFLVSFMGDDLLGSNRPDGSKTLQSKVFTLMNSFMARIFYDFSIVKSKEMQNVLGEANSQVIPNGVDTELFYPEDKPIVRNRLGLSNDKKIVLFVSKPNRPEKNFSLANKSVQNLKNHDFELKILFDKPQDEVRDWMNACDVMVLTSYHEGSPNVIKEAMVCNCPIVSTDVGDVKEVIGDTEGCFIGGYDVEDFSKQLEKAIEFSRTKGKTKGRERILELGLDSETVAKRIIEVYRRVLDKKQPTSP